jgi:hypothetical protein
VFGNTTTPPDSKSVTSSNNSKTNGTSHEHDHDRDDEQDLKNVNVSLSNALGLVGFRKYRINHPPYFVKTCDQVLLIHGKKLNLEDFSVREDAFMTLSVYFANFFKTKDVNGLIMSMETQSLTHELTKIPGAPGCAMFKTSTQEYPICFRDENIREQIQEAVTEFLKCRDSNTNHLEKIMRNCDFSKVDFSSRGPFGKLGKKMKEIVDKIKKEKSGPELDHNNKMINRYYVDKGVPGDKIKDDSLILQNQINLFGVKQ